jgi:Zn-dependent metalloprotease
MFLSRRLLQITSVIVILTIIFSGFPIRSASAQKKDGLKRQVNTQTGKVSFIGPESGRALSASQALGTVIRPQDPAMALAKRFGAEFGLKNPERDLSQMKTHRSENGRIIARYQQKYQGIPIMGGELIVTTNDNGDLYSMNGEMSSDLSLTTQPAIESDQNIVAAERVVYKVNGTNTSFSEMMALPNIQLDTTYWLPWYNNIELDTQLRFGVP